MVLKNQSTGKMHNLNTYIELCDRAIDWVGRYRPEQFEKRFLDIVEQRRVLKQIRNSMSNNPAIAAYGKSQVGKSYLMSNLLQDKGRPFIVSSDGNEYDFINQMNPRTEKTEATGVVTRFSSFDSCPERYKEKHPIMMRTLSVTDIASILAEGYYNDITDFTTPAEAEIDQFVAELQNKYTRNLAIDTPAVTADEMLDMKFYFSKYINSAQIFKNRGFFDKTALFIEKVPVEEIHKVFSVLWNNNTHLTGIFIRLVNLLRRLDFRRHVYLPAEALLHHENNENTIMSVQCLRGLANSNGQKTEVYVCTGGENFTTVSDVLKSELSGLCAEIVLRIPDELLVSSDSYCFDMIDDPAVKAVLGKGNITKDILRKTDLLDFPGARSRQMQLAAKLEQPEVLTNVLLRGKVAYLFNRYCEDRMINILMFCHHNESNDVTSIPLLLNNWVERYVGKNPEERAGKLRDLNGISPLFYVATMFNVDLKYDTNSKEANGPEGVANRWQARFSKVLVGECFGGSMNWYRNWDGEGDRFNNSYLLRDFKYSGAGASYLYDGFAREGRETEWIIPENRHTPENEMKERAHEYYRTLRESFIGNPHVKELFDNPALAWDVAATMNNDGALYIIQRLGEVCSRISDYRKKDCRHEMQAAVETVLRTIADYHVSQDAEEILRENIRKAKAIRREMDMACNDDNYFFGHLIASLQLDERDTLNEVHALIHGNILNQEVQNFSEYEIISTRCKKFRECESDSDCWKRLIEVYGFKDRKEAESYLEKRNIDPDALFRRTFERKKNSYHIAGTVLGMWKRQIESIDILRQFVEEGGMDPVALDYLVSLLLISAGTIDLESRLAANIEEQVDITNISNVNEELVADVLTETVNEFVMDLGYAWLDEETREQGRRTAASDSTLELEYIDRPAADEITDEYITNLFNGTLKAASPLGKAFEDSYFKWMEYVVMAFVSHISCPEYDREANEQLEEIMKGLR